MKTKSLEVSKNIKSARMNLHTLSRSDGDTEKIAKNFLAHILKKENKKATVVGLYGDLGTGKTTFVKSVAKVLGVKRKVNSPTFVIMKKYPIKRRMHKFLFHLDAYRLKDSNELNKLGWSEIISNKENLVLIEWPENVKKTMPKRHHKISISHTKEGHRAFKIQTA